MLQLLAALSNPIYSTLGVGIGEPVYFNDYDDDVLYYRDKSVYESIRYIR